MPVAQGAGTGYERLDAVPVIATIEHLQARIRSRFPQRNLAEVAAELTRTAHEVAAGAGAIQSRLRHIRVASRLLMALVVVMTLVALGYALRDAGSTQPARSLDWLPLIESTINDVVFAAIAIFFLHTAPARLHRGHLLELLHELRSLAHIIDMHQLTKDPERLREGFVPTTSSVDPGLGRDDMERYLDYCSELLSLVGKVAALCAEESQDAVVLDTISTIETLTNAMARKIWQKISVLSD